MAQNRRQCKNAHNGEIFIRFRPGEFVVCFVALIKIVEIEMRWRSWKKYAEMKNARVKKKDEDFFLMKMGK